MISIISFDERELVARFQGHGSWINSVAFDPWRCDGRNYRFGSVADDRRILLWDFNASMLQRPRAVSSDLFLSRSLGAEKACPEPVSHDTKLGFVYVNRC